MWLIGCVVNSRETVNVLCGRLEKWDVSTYELQAFFGGEGGQARLYVIEEWCERG
jgi:hypothetical protein